MARTINHTMKATILYCSLLFILFISTLSSCNSESEKPSYKDAKESAEYTLEGTESKISLVASLGGVSGSKLKQLLTEYYTQTELLDSKTVEKNDAVIQSLAVKFGLTKKQVAVFIFNYETHNNSDVDSEEEEAEGSGDYPY